MKRAFRRRGEERERGEGGGRRGGEGLAITETGGRGASGGARRCDREDAASVESGRAQGESRWIWDEAGELGRMSSWDGGLWC